MSNIVHPSYIQQTIQLDEHKIHFIFPLLHQYKTYIYETPDKDLLPVQEPHSQSTKEIVKSTQIRCFFQNAYNVRQRTRGTNMSTI